MKNVNQAKAFVALLLMVFFAFNLSAQSGLAKTEPPAKTAATSESDCGFMICTGCECKLDFCPCASSLGTTEQQRKNILRYESLLRSYDSDVTTKTANDIALIRIAIQNNDLVLFKSAFEGYQKNVTMLSQEEKTSIQTWGAATHIAVSVEAKE
jgi:hypothetical protein